MNSGNLRMLEIGLLVLHHVVLARVPVVLHHAGLLLLLLSLLLGLLGLHLLLTQHVSLLLCSHLSLLLCLLLLLVYHALTLLLLQEFLLGGSLLLELSLLDRETSFLFLLLAFGLFMVLSHHLNRLKS